MNTVVLYTAALLALAQAETRGADEDRARALFEAGGVAYGRAQYADAARAFDAAYALSPRPAIAFSLAQALRRSYLVDRDPAALERAIALYTLYLQEVPSGGRREDATDQLQVLLSLRAQIRERPESPPPPPPATELMVYSRTPGARITLDGALLEEGGGVRRVTPGSHALHAEAEGYFPESRTVEAVESRLVPVELALRPRPAALSLDVEDDARVTVDGERTVLTPLGAPLSLSAGEHALVVEKSGHRPWSGSITLARGESRALAVPLELTAQREAAYWTLGGSAGLAVAGLTTTVLALHFQGRAQAVTDARGARNVSAAELMELDADAGRRNALRTSSAVLYSTAVVALATGLILYLTDPD